MQTAQVPQFISMTNLRAKLIQALKDKPDIKEVSSINESLPTYLPTYS